MEMMLALALGMLLLLALYLTLNTHFISAQASRDVVAETTLARNILNRIATDITDHLGAVDLRGLVDASAAPADPAAAAGTATAADTMTPVKFNLGVQGDGSYLRLSSYRVQKPRSIGTGVDTSAEVTSDLRRINYWIVSNGADTLGLARAEFKLATSADADQLPSALDDQAKYVIASQVKNITFEYYDGSRGGGGDNWMGSWDGGEVASLDGASLPTGPPAAIRITITLRRSVKGMAATDTPSGDGPTYRHVVAIPASNSFKAKEALTP